MTVRIYRHPIVRVQIPSDWLFLAEQFAREYVSTRPEEIAKKILRWAETWYLCTGAFTWYYGGDFQSLVDKALKTGWTPWEVLTVGKHTYYLTTSQIHEKWNFGSTVSGAISRKQAKKSRADIFVVSVLNLPDVDIVGWFNREQVSTLVEGTRHILPESCANPMIECPGLAAKDKNHWYV